MSDHLDKARAALERARDLTPGVGDYDDLLIIARTQAELAQAEALDRIANVLEDRHRADLTARRLVAS